METLRLLYLAAGPGVALAVYIYYSDKSEPEPKKLVAQCFLLGALAWFPTYIYEDEFQKLLGWQGILTDDSFSWWQQAIYAFFGVALAEELCKFLFLRGFIFNDREFNEPFDGVIYGGVVGCGFATLENLMYVFPQGYEVGIIRMLTAVPGHVFEGMILGYFMGKARFCPNPNKNLIGGLGLVILLHGFYDFAAFLDSHWAIYLIFGMVVLSIYLGLKAKRKLEIHSKYVTSATTKFFLLKGGNKQGPLNLADIRDYLSAGKMDLEDTLITAEAGEKKSVRDLLCFEMSHESKGLIQIPPEGQPVAHLLIFYVMTFGLYIYFWFYRNYCNFKEYKNLDINPEFRVLGFFILTIIPYFTYGTILRELGGHSFPLGVEISFYLIMVGIETMYLFFLLLMIRENIELSVNCSAVFLIVVILFFSLGCLRKFLPWVMSYPWWLEIILIWLQGGVLSLAQLKINIFWMQKINEHQLFSVKI
jgi:RsiW-degrading membrane proteinase PrsW (M82 family)